MEQNNEIREMTPKELVELINRQEEDTILRITIEDIQEGGSHAGSKDI